MVAAEKIEFDGIRQHVDIRVLDWDVEFAATSTNEQFALVANGPGKRLAADAVRSACERLNITKVVSTGFCGGLEPSLPIGGIVIANQVNDLGSGVTYPTYSFAAPSAVCGTVLTSDRVAVTAEEKQHLASKGAIAVEMEAAGVAVEAQRRGLPFCCVRVVSDTAQESMPLDFNEYRSSDGRFNRTAIAFAAMRHPFERVPALRTLQRNCQVASAQLGDFIAKCNF